MSTGQKASILVFPGFLNALSYLVRPWLKQFSHLYLLWEPGFLRQPLVFLKFLSPQEWQSWVESDCNPVLHFSFVWHSEPFSYRSTLRCFHFRLSVWLLLAPVTHTVLTKQLITSTQVLNLWTQEIRLSSHPSSILHSPGSSCHANPSFTVISVPSVTGFSTPFVMLLPTKFYTTKVSTFNEKNLSPFLWSQWAGHPDDSLLFFPRLLICFHSTFSLSSMVATCRVSYIRPLFFPARNVWSAA